jgi:ribosome-binding protein aMBF1 (putative translation factor)
MPDKIEERTEIEAFDTAVAREEKGFPIEVARALLAGKESRIKILRCYRKLSQGELSELAGCDTSVISQIEEGTTPTPRALLKKIAEALDVELDDLV